jgi:tetratricopeptide (TPR) repeat protein
MVRRHPARAQLARFGSGGSSGAENRAVVRHLLSGCARCRRTLERVWADRFDYTAAFAAARRALTARRLSFVAEREATPALLAELSGHPVERQRLLVAREPRFQTWSLCDLLLEASREQGFEDPGRALELAELGAAVAAQLDPAAYGPARVNDIAARAWATLANAQRIRADFRSAEEGFARAEELLREGTGDPLEKAQVLLLKASLRGNQGRVDEAARLLDRVVRIAAQSGDAHLRGKALITKGFLRGIAGEPAAAIELLQAGLAEVDVLAEPRLLVAARHNLILYLNECGHPHEALALLAATRPLYTELGDRMNLVRLRWLEGKIALGLGELERAEALFQEVRRDLLAQEIGFDAALLSLDLAGVYARQGRSAEMRRLAGEILPIFQSCAVEREVMAALIVFQQAAEMERVTLDLVQELAESLRRCRETPGARSRDSL